MSLLIISDLHIWGPDDPMYLSLLALLRVRAAAGDTVVLAGDLFDLFVGNKPHFTEMYSEFFKALEEASLRGVKFHYIEGNHDFLLHRAFQKLSAVTIHPHDVSVELGGKSFFLAHGDTVVRSDYGYRFLRVFFRSPVMRILVAVLPGKWLAKVGEFSSQKSRATKALLPSDLPLKRMEYLRRVYRSYAAERLGQGYDFVVMGHCHDLDEMMFNIGGRLGQYVNVGYPRMHGSFLSWSPGEEKIQREKLP